MPVYNWSTTAGTNATADATINWAEGMAPSAVNDSARAMMAALAKWAGDISGAIVTGGSSTAYTVSSNSSFDTLAHMSGQMIAFVPHITSTNSVPTEVTLNVDGLGAKNIRFAPGIAVPGGTLVIGTPYVVTYNNSDGVFYLQSPAWGNPYNIPIGGLMPYVGTTAPNSAFVLPFGQAISRTTYNTLWVMVGTTFGAGDGSTTFNVPDLRGRAPFGQDNMGGSAAGRIGTSVSTDNGTINGQTLGSAGGQTSHALTSGEMPTHTHSVTDPGHTHSFTAVLTANGGQLAAAGANYLTANNASGGTTGSSTTGISLGNAGSGSAHSNMPPAIILSYILRVI